MRVISGCWTSLSLVMGLGNLFFTRGSLDSVPNVRHNCATLYTVVPISTFAKYALLSLAPLRLMSNLLTEVPYCMIDGHVPFLEVTTYEEDLVLEGDTVTPWGQGAGAGIAGQYCQFRR